MNWLSDGIRIEGLDEFEKMIQDAVIDDSDVKKAMKKALEPIAETVENNTPVRTGKLKKSVKKQVKTDGLGVVGIVKLGKFYDMFEEFGTSQQKHHVGFFDRAVRSSADESLNILGKELFKKLK
ncbi:HK97-gp10 family putative phage morphogenesis protein [Clostridium novyi]|uniref:HK97-gp10 family putative phage morphogenesis protein n=1 Tax=Clostridium novyi TaxID=1542 RepID=UPI0030B9078E